MSALTPSVVAAIDDLELAARLVVEGMRTGHHRSPLHGFTAEFSQHRPYRVGDDLKHFDWKVLARTDRLYTRQYRETTNMAVVLAIDASASMGFPEGDVSKLRYAVVVAAALSYLIIQQGDAVGMMTLQDGSLRYVPPKGGRPHLRVLVAELSKLKPSGVWDPQRVISRSAELLSRRGLLVAISDFYDAEDEAARELRRAGRRGHDVAMLQILSRPEITFPYKGDLDFEDLETGVRQIVDAESIGQGYRAGVADFMERCRRQSRRDGRDYALLPTDMPPAQALRGFLVRRSAGQGDTERTGAGDR